jgi:hypothetical protein
MNTLNVILTTLSNVELPDYEGVENFRKVFENDPVWYEQLIPDIGNSIKSYLITELSNFGIWLVSTGKTISYWTSTVIGIYSVDRYAITKDKDCLKLFSKTFLIYLFLTLLYSVL